MKNKVLPKFKTNYNTEFFHDKGEKIDPVSLTIPNETYSLREIVERFSVEYPKHMLRNGYYDGEDENIDFDDVDLTRTPDFDLSDAYEMKDNLTKKFQSVSEKAKSLNIFKNKTGTEKQAKNEPLEVSKPNEV